MRSMTSIAINQGDIKDIIIDKISTKHAGICHVIRLGSTDAIYLWDEAYDLFIDRINAEVKRVEAIDPDRNK